MENKEMTIDQVWGLASRIACEEKDGGLSPLAMDQIFGKQCFSGDIFRDYTPEQVEEKINKWQKRQ